MNYLISLFISFSFLAFGGKPLPPAPHIFVYDEATLLSASEKNQVNQSLADFEKSTGAQMVVAIFSSLEGEDLEDYTNRLFRAWKIGDKEKNNGLLLVISVKDRKFRLEVGYGLEGTIPDSRAKQFTQDYLVPEFKQGRYAAGIEALIRNLKNEILRLPVETLDKKPQPTPSFSTGTKGTLILIGFGLCLILTLVIPEALLLIHIVLIHLLSFPLFILVFLILFPCQLLLLNVFGKQAQIGFKKRGRSRSSSHWDGGGWDGGGWGGGSWGSGSWGGGGGGGFSGGGGSSGGGGASGSW